MYIYIYITVQVAYTPRKCAALKDSGSLVVIERDHNADRAIAKEFKMTSVPGSIDAQGQGGMPYSLFGVHRAGEAKCASCIRVVAASAQQRNCTKQVACVGIRVYSIRPRI